MEFEFSVEVNASQNAMWKVVTDHVRWSQWMPAKKVVLAREGSPERNGLGAVRVFKIVGGISAAKEEIVGWEPPHSMSYILHSSFPSKNYRSTVTLVSDGEDKCRLFWKSDWEYVPPAWLGGKMFGKRLKKMLHSAAKEMAVAASHEI